MRLRYDDVLQAVDMLKPRAKTLVQFRDAANFIFAQRPLPMDKKAEKVIADPTTKYGRGHRVY
jgi:glutamyl-tRNA synthetase